MTDYMYTHYKRSYSLVRSNIGMIFNAYYKYTSNIDMIFNASLASANIWYIKQMYMTLNYNVYLTHV
jgi:hypothetical protein